MKNWLAINTLESFTEKPRQFIDKDGLHVAICKVGEAYFAFESMCTHAMYELDDAPIEGEEVICPLHGARFCLKTGAVMAPPAYEDLRVFPVRVQDGMVEIEWD